MKRKIILYFPAIEKGVSNYSDISNFSIPYGKIYYSMTSGTTTATLSTPVRKPNRLIKNLIYQIGFSEATNARIAKYGYGEDDSYIKVEVGLTDGTDDYYWNGASWVTGSSFSTEEDALNNLESFNYDRTKGIGIRFRFTRPKEYQYDQLDILGVKLLAEFDINYVDDIMFRSFKREMSEIKAVSRIYYKNSFSGSTVDFGDINLAHANYNNAVPIGVYDKNNDPDFLDNLLSSYNSGTKVITLSETVSSASIFIYFEYNPSVHFQTSNDFREVAKFPNIVIEDFVESIVSDEMDSYTDSVIRRDDYSGYQIPAPVIKNFNFQLCCEAHGNFDYNSLKEAIDSWSSNNPLLTCKALDQEFDISKSGGFTNSSFPNKSDERRGVATFSILNIPHYEKSPDVIKGFETIGVDIISAGRK